MERNKRLTQKEFIKRCIERFGNNIFDFSDIVYVNNRTKVKVKCKKCGYIWYVRPDYLLKAKDCPICRKEETKKIISRKLSMGKEKFIQKARKVHGNKYDYSLVEYRSNKIKVKIICPKHGIFEQTPNSHLKGRGCRKCALEEQSKRQTMTKEQFIRKAKKVHGDKYDYSLVNYKGSHSKVKIICPKHGIFEQLAYMHLQGSGCPKCAIEKIKESLRTGIQGFIEKAKKIHGDKYDYSLVEYVNKDTKIKIICKNCNRIFLQTPHNHLTGYGCPHCNKGGIDFTKPSFLYYIKIECNNKNFYKIGITNKRNIYNRFKPEDQKKMKVIKVWKFENGYEALEKEQKILKEYKDFLYNGNEKILISNGNTEIFVKDILNLDRKGDYYYDIRAYTA